MTSAEPELSKPLDELGPVDYLVVGFPAGASSFTGEMARELVRLVEAGTIRIVDVLICLSTPFRRRGFAPCATQWTLTNTGMVDREVTRR